MVSGATSSEPSTMDGVQSGSAVVGFSPFLNWQSPASYAQAFWTPRLAAVLAMSHRLSLEAMSTNAVFTEWRVASTTFIWPPSPPSELPNS